MQGIRSACRRLAACAAAAVLVSAAGGVFPLPVSADDGPVYEYSVLAGGNQIGLNVYIRAAGVISDVMVDDKTCEDYDRTDDGIVVLLPVKAPEMARKHSVTYKLDGTDYTVPAVSACDYLKKLKSDSADKYQSVAEAMLNYGYTAEAYFSESASLSDYGLTAAPSLGEVPGSPFTGKETFNQNLEALDMQFRYYGMNLSLLDETQFTLYFETFNEDGEHYLTDGQFGGEYVENTNGSAGEGYWKVWRNVPASKLTEVYTYSNLPADPVDFSPLQYLAAASKSTDTRLAAVCKALYAYGEAVKEAASIHKGRLTLYEFNTGCATLDEMVAEKGCAVAALTDEDYNKYAGGWVEITYGDKKLNALVADAMPFAKNPTRKAGDVDIDKQSFLDFIGEETGDLPITWKLIAMPDADNEDVSVRFKDGSKISWCAVTLLNARYPVKAVKYNDAELELNYNDLNLTNNFFAGSLGQPNADNIYTFTFIDIFDHELTVDVPYSLPTGEQGIEAPVIVKCEGQFPE